MLPKLIVVLISLIYCINAISTFVDKGNRPEFFELTDSVVATFRITMPSEQFNDMKKSLNIGSTPLIDSFNERIQMANFFVSNFIDGLTRMNYTLLSPEYPLKDLFPQLKIGDDGMSQINKEEIISGMHFEPEYYINIKDKNGILMQAITSNPNFDIYNLVIAITSLNLLNNPYIDPIIKELLSYYISSEELFEFKTKNSTLEVEINSVKKSFNKVTFSVGGQSSRYLNKPGYNIKIRGNKDLYGRTQFKLRSDVVEPTYLRSKLASDIHKSLGLKGISSNYVTLYINDEYFGLFIISDAYKLSWIEYEYCEKDTTSLYKCQGNLESSYPYNSFINQNDNVTDLTEIMELLKIFDKAQSASDIKDIFDVNNFLTEISIEYLLGSWDNFNNMNNFFLYKQPTGKWIYLTNDYDNSFGANMEIVFCGYVYVDFPERMAQCLKDYTSYNLEEYYKPLYRVNNFHMIDILILKDPSHFEKIISNIVKKEKIRNENGIYPGGYNLNADTINSYDEWDANSKFTAVKSMCGLNVYGIKYWILAKYRNVCKTYKMECDPIYMDENYQYSVNKEVEFKGYNISDVLLLSNDTNTTIETPITNITTTTTDITTPIPTITNSFKCWAELIVYAQDEYGDWGYDFTKQEWCGLTLIVDTDNSNDECWSESFGYPCCKKCKVIEIDDDGNWGFEYNQWCGIPTSCNL
ncbi:hypothetical protein BCR32DRAFT_282304 [Anaeromyces robustus]|uniref:CBM10 domain-containing protein n=1 Tax=Anaeromyces robustus TaxID=1754192 RepID=A0A1Y1WYA0_9FUNG|nr:hypothetical protein BCR32DRAFT_282304 [Anaeromyces robustus]|eukprot:ORX78422.1 hypothetical protein BCR32DRAFT_282304 [Anaeromyces robustus]